MGGPSRSALLVFLLLAVLSGSLAARAWLVPPRGTVFVGTFYYVDDFYNYLSYVEQAQRGALVFRDKLAPPSLPPTLVNLEWLAVGWLSALCGGRPLLAYRLFGLVAVAALVFGCDRYLARSGLPPERRLAGLLLVSTGGGLGGLLLLLGRIPVERALDLVTGAFPFIEALANPHFVAGTALLLAALAAFADGRLALGAILGNALALVRPYDAVLLVGIEGLAVVLTSRPREWPRRLLPVLALVPAIAYVAWVLLAGRAFAGFSTVRAEAVAASPDGLALALGPAALLAVLAVRVPRGEGSRHRLRLALWALVAFAVVVARPVAFSLQPLVGIGLPLLGLGALGLARLRRGALEASIPLMASTAAVATWLCAIPGPGSHAPVARWRVAAALRETCRPGEIVVAPPDVGLYAGGLSPCWPYVSHAAAPEHDARAAAVRRFYGEASPDERAALLAQAGAALVVLPSGLPPGWLGAGAVLEATPSARGDGLAAYRCHPAPGP